MPTEAPFTVRLPEELATALRERAAADHRSLNKEIVFLLEQSLFPTVDADAYADARRRSLATAARYTTPRPFKQGR